MNNTQFLGSVFCGRCKTTLGDDKIICKGLSVYKCKCGLKVRALLKCNFCNKPFFKMPCLVRKTNYCSLDCYWTGTNRSEYKVCKRCGQEFRVSQVLIKKGYGFYCSKECWFGLFENARKKLICRQCGKAFIVTKAVFKKGPKYCSKTCKDDFNRDHVTKICRNCKKEFKLPRSDVNRGRGSFCTWECYKHFDGETYIEKTVRLELEKIKIPFIQEAKFARFHADFYLPDKKTIIECDGEYWHAQEKIKKRDLRKEEFLKDQGYKIIRFSGQEINRGIFKKFLRNI
ncbi:MAG: hypothetical protein UT38_C0014G0003 [Microgenomates group bacterium GW2011_GWA2_39_19]|nr:MAG: hypothetical protein UT38_C0014G0003 [Microgenomates group bacterium GW2011_GWA2_39_19]